uniref:Putative conserved plasma membrane protein n=1 Tax=Triatoma dimidiata TaxID=72491 RepID=A0A0V0GA38_TRIDM
MPINYFELINAAEVVAEKEEMKVTMKYALGGAVFTTCTTLLGALTAGPVGLGIGGALGGIAASVYTKGKFKSVVTIIREDLNEHQKQRLAEHLERVVRDFQITDLAKLALLLKSNEALYMEIFKVLKYFLENDMKYTLTQ